MTKSIELIHDWITNYTLLLLYHLLECMPMYCYMQALYQAFYLKRKACRLFHAESLGVRLLLSCMYINGR